jgi:hypothetical protein
MLHDEIKVAKDKVEIIDFMAAKNGLSPAIVKQVKKKWQNIITESEKNIKNLEKDII